MLTQPNLSADNISLHLISLLEKLSMKYSLTGDVS